MRRSRRRSPPVASSSPATTAAPCAPSRRGVSSGWLPFAFVAALHAARRERPDAIYSSSPPQAGHLAALAVHRLTGIPWVADFRDEWAADAFRADQPRPLARLAGRLERAITAN